MRLCNYGPRSYRLWGPKNYPLGLGEVEPECIKKCVELTIQANVTNNTNVLIKPNKK